MARNRYEQNDRTSRKDQKVSQALSFAGLAQDQQALSDRAQSARVAQAISMLGLMQQQQQDQAQAQRAMEMLGFQREDAQRQGQQADARLQFDQNRLASEEREGSANRERAMTLGVVGAAGQMPTLPPDVMMKYLSTIDPRFGAAAEGSGEAAKAAQLKALGFNPDGTPAVDTSKPVSGNPYVTAALEGVTAPQRSVMAVPQLIQQANNAVPYTPPPAPSGVGGAANLNLMQLLNFLHRR